MHPLGSSGTAEERQERQRKFRAACFLAGKTVKSVAREMGVNDNHLYLVMRGTRESRRLIQKVEAFIAQHLPDGIEPVLPPMPGGPRHG